MTFILNLYTVTLDFIYKISGPIIAIAVIGLIVYYRQGVSNFISSNISKIKGKVAGQEFEIDLNKLKESQSEKAVDDKRVLVKKNPEELAKELEFEKIYSIIFGSQIELLNELRASPKNPLQIGLYFGKVRVQFQVYQEWSLEEFLKIVVNNALISVGEQYKITQKGLDFLKYIEENNYNDRLF